MGETFCKMTQSVQQRRMRRCSDVYSEQHLELLKLYRDSGEISSWKQDTEQTVI